ncbi:MAG: proton-conducting transporter membrane subunit, partial [Candidatus Promineifilaceae bacterium]
ILAYSTISQLGYMFLGVGAGAYVAGIFHLTTHAFFKALLFLCAGSVMHALSGELDIFKMGGLRKKLPWTFATFLVGVLALSGLPLLSGFFSKDEILVGAFEHGALVPWLLGVVTAALTAFYAFRLLFVAFYGKSRLDKRTEKQAHESPPVMLVPLVILAILAGIGGFIGLPAFVGIGNAIDEFLYPVFSDSQVVHAATGGAAVEAGLISVSTVAAVVGLLAAYWIYIRRWGLAARLTKSAQWLYDIIYNKYYVDELYTEAVVKPLRTLGQVLAETVDQRSIDRIVNGIAELIGLAGTGLRRLQTGLVRNYALAMLAGVIAILAYFFLRTLLGS